MCGIAGIIRKDKSVSAFEMEQMTNALQHRGPDGWGCKLMEQVAIGHRRLSIIDIEGGRQPLSNEDGTIWITFNGEIYNFQELRVQLLAKGHLFRTASDTEVVVHAYEEWGHICVSKLRGMFAFAVVDQNKKEVFLARDHFGIKPLVYGISNGIFCFASEIQALRQVHDFSCSIDLEGLDQYLQFQYIPAPATIYKEVKKLPPAHFMVVDFHGQLQKKESYWKLEFKEGAHKTREEWKEELEAVIKESVRAHLVSDVPFGAFLSGGIDSSAVVGMMAQQMQQPVKTFSIGFKEEQYNELEYARTVARKWGTDHYEEIVEPDALEILPDLVRHYGEPFGDSSAIPTWYVSRLARRHVTMVLTGDAGDELFAGYQSYTRMWSRHATPVPNHLTGLKKLAYPLMNAVRPTKYPLKTANLKDWLRYIHYCDDAARQQFWKPDFQQQFKTMNRSFLEQYFQEAASYSHFQKAQYLDFNSYLPGDILAKVDVASMIHSLETRTPLLDLKVVEFAATIPQQINIRKRDQKWEGKLLLKEMLSKYYPEDFIYRKKMGFATPIDHWFGASGKQKQDVRDRILDSSNILNDFFNATSLKGIVNGNNAGQQWLFLFLLEWLEQNKSKSKL